MFQYLRKAVSGSNVKDSRNNLVRDEYRKKKLKDNLAAQIKKLQKANINNPNQIIERNDEDAHQVCFALEAIFLHECEYHGYALPNMNLRSMFADGIRPTDDDIMSIAFWDLLKEVTHKGVITQLEHLVVTSEVGLCRAWIRLALNDGLIVSYLDAILADKNQLSKHYAPNAFLMDNELPYILKELLQGLMQFEFRLNYNSSKLNTWDILPLQIAGILPSDERKNSINEPSVTLHNRTIASEKPQTARLKDVQTKEPVIANVSKRTDYHDSKVLSNVYAEKLDKENSNPPIKTHITSERHTILQSDTTVTDSSSKSFHEQTNLEDRNVILDRYEQNEAQNTEKVENSQDTINTTIEEVIEKTEDMTNLSGNRLGGNGWSGWSSAFDGVPDDSLEEVDVGDTLGDKKETPVNTEIESFGSLLQVYGTNNPNVEVSSSTTDQIDGDEKKVLDLSESIITIEPDQTEEVKSPSQSEINLVEQMNFEVVPMSDSLQKEYVDQKTQLSLNQLTVIGVEQGLDQQCFRCKHCGKAIGLIYGPYRVCYFDGGYYCYDCHEDEEHIVPSRVIQNWDFRKHKVSKYSNLFLMKIEEEPLFHIDESNPYLYEVVVDLKEVKLLRLQLQHIREYVQTCRQDIAEDFRIRLWPREYLCDDIHQYSLLDLVQVHTGQLAHHLKKIISQFSKHIYKCNLCRQKGFICEYCHNETIIYPFQVNIAVQCPGCLATFHKQCRRDKRCPKCVRIHLRSQNKNELDRRISVTQKEQYTNSDIL